MEHPIPHIVNIQLTGSHTLCNQLREWLPNTPNFRVRASDITDGYELIDRIKDRAPTLLILDAALENSFLPQTLDHLDMLNVFMKVIVIAEEYTETFAMAGDFPVVGGTILHQHALSPLLQPVVFGVSIGCRYITPDPAYADKLGLSDYEDIILRLMAVGLDAGTIARRMDRSASSVYSAQNSIRNKLRMNTNQQAILMAQRERIVPVLIRPEDPPPLPVEVV